MDIRNNKTILQTRIKRFTLKATASAIFTLNAEAVMAACVCTSPITDASCATQQCDFTTGSSFIVEIGGEVGSILMSNYQPTNSYIAVEAGGDLTVF